MRRVALAKCWIGQKLRIKNGVLLIELWSCIKKYLPLFNTRYEICRSLPKGLNFLNDDDETLKFRIVGPEEIYGRNDYSSIDSPISRACLKKEVDDEVVVKTPAGEKIWYVSNIHYEK